MFLAPERDIFPTRPRFLLANCPLQVRASLRISLRSSISQVPLLAHGCPKENTPVGNWAWRGEVPVQGVRLSFTRARKAPPRRIQDGSERQSLGTEKGKMTGSHTDPPDL